MAEFNGETYDPLRPEALALLAKHPGRSYTNEVRAMALELQQLRAERGRKEADGIDILGISWNAGRLEVSTVSPHGLNENDYVELVDLPQFSINAVYRVASVTNRLYFTLAFPTDPGRIIIGDGYVRRRKAL